MSQDLLKDIIQEFDPAKLARFFRSKNSGFIPKSSPISTEDSDKFSEAQLIGEIPFPAEATTLVICAIRTDNTLSERSGKKAQYDFARKYLSSTQKEAGIFVYYDLSGNFRFSLVYPQFSGTKRTWSNFRRFTYYVSPELTNKTFLQRVGARDFESMNTIKDTFSVEKVTNQFFDEFHNYFEKAKIDFEKHNSNTVMLYLKQQSAGEKEIHERKNKIIYSFFGRLIFLYFIQRKGWLEGNVSYLREYINKPENSNYYFTLLNPLFFEVLAVKKSDRKGLIAAQYSHTPYLNGGLFEKSDIDRLFPTLLFSDNFVKDLILNLFERYNFTIDENSPEDQEVSIDPEMLGKVFENTLAEEERGEKGTFYTPREIVHYMVKEALLQFLCNETSIENTKLKSLVFSEDLGLIDKSEARIIDYKLEHIKILDPAVGSAAFPVEMMNVLVRLRKLLDVHVGSNVNEVELKKTFIKHNLHGVDIDPGAIEIAKLRLWLSLVVDYEQSDVEPEILPNLDFQFRLGNSLLEKVAGIEILPKDYFYSKGKLLFGPEQQELLSTNTPKQMGFNISSTSDRVIAIQNVIDQYFEEENQEIRKALKHRFDKLENEIFSARISDLITNATEILANSRGDTNREKIAKKMLSEVESLKSLVKQGTHKLFIPRLHFADVFQKNGGFDIVIGNPPYSGKEGKVSQEVQESYGLGSKDPYGAFISASLSRFLKPGGVLSFIVSDTWLTIKSHYMLRKQVLEKQLHKVIKLNKDAFNATVNACILTLTNSRETNIQLIAADLTNLSTRTDAIELQDKLSSLDKEVGVANPRYAVYSYSQELIKTNSNFPIFTASPKLFCIMNDLKSITIIKEGISTRQININGKIINLVKFGDIADVKQGLATGDNHYYLYQNPEARGSYKSILEYNKYLLSEKDINKIVQNDDIRFKVIERGIHKSTAEPNFDEDLWFGGRYIVPYDKGGESDTEEGWLPNYFVPTNYFIDWSTESITRMKSYTIADRIQDRQENKTIKPSYKTTKAAVFRNTDKYFQTGITFSRTGQYSPSFRKSSSTVFDTEGSTIFTKQLSVNNVIGVLVSKLTKYILKNYIGHTVHTQVDELKELPFVPSNNKKIDILVNSIITNQMKNPRHNYLDREQKEIDCMVCELYGLNIDDIYEIEAWYARRYPKLALANVFNQSSGKYTNSAGGK